MKPRGFTLIELLVVVAIIVALLAILMPSLGRAVRLAQDASCRSNLRQTGMALTMFAAEHRGVLPGTAATNVGPEPWQKSWLGAEVATYLSTQPGTLVPYVGGADSARKLYRCPGLEVGVRGGGRGSNGDFDYATRGSFAGARLQRIPLTARLRDEFTLQMRHSLPTSLILEEDPAFHVNSIYFDPNHSSINRLAMTHPGGGNYAAIDLHVHQEPPPPWLGGIGPQALDWFVRRNDLDFSLTGGTYGSWQ